jgi:hypothetical protein
MILLCVLLHAMKAQATKAEQGASKGSDCNNSNGCKSTHLDNYWDGETQGLLQDSVIVAYGCIVCVRNIFEWIGSLIYNNFNFIESNKSFCDLV